MLQCTRCSCPCTAGRILPCAPRLSLILFIVSRLLIADKTVAVRMTPKDLAELGLQALSRRRRGAGNRKPWRRRRNPP